MGLSGLIAGRVSHWRVLPGRFARSTSQLCGEAAWVRAAIQWQRKPGIV